MVEISDKSDSLAMLRGWKVLGMGYTISEVSSYEIRYTFAIVRQRSVKYDLQYTYLLSFRQTSFQEEVFPDL
jgi:hypothetical protein